MLKELLCPILTETMRLVGAGGQISYALWVGHTSLPRAVSSDKFSPWGKLPPTESVKGEAWERERQRDPP